MTDQRNPERCLACGRKVKDLTKWFDGQGPYCLDCVRNRSACGLCGAPLTDEHWYLSDDRIICKYCQNSSIFTSDQAAALYKAMKEIVDEDLGIRLNIPTGLGLVDRNQLKDVIRSQQESNSDRSDRQNELNPEHTLGIFIRNGIRRGIYVQVGLPRVLFLQVAAHEYTHAWQSENCPILRDPVVQEGLAEWVSYKSIGHYGYRANQQRMLDRRDIYGDGLRWALGLESKHGAAALIEACRTRY